jgi:hypothetical protein
MAMLDDKLTKYAQEDDKGRPIDLTRYQPLPGGKGVIVPRRSAGGGNPMVDPRKGASQFTVVDIDEDEHGNLTTTVHQPGTTDVSGDPLPKEAPCQPSPAPKTSPQSRTERKQTRQKHAAQPKASPAPKTPATRPASPTCPDPSMSELEQLMQLHSELSRLKEEMQAMRQRQSEQSSSLPEKPGSDTSAEPEASPLIPVEFRAPYGVFRCQVEAIQRDDALLALVYRAEADVQFIPSPGQDVSITWPGGSVVARPHGLAFKLQLGHTYLVVLLSIPPPAEPTG